MAGIEQRILGPISLDLQLYYKDLFDLAIPTDAVVVRDGEVVRQRYVNAGTGKAYGAELLLRWNPGGRFFGWIAYSVSRSIRDQDLVGGTLMPTGDTFDQPHNVVALGTLELPELWDGFSTGFRLRYTSGNPYRRVVTAVNDTDADRFQAVFESSPSGRVPAFFQLDVRADKRWTYRTWMLAVYLEVQNVTNRKNPEGVTYNYDYSERGWVTGLPLFPSFGIRAEY
jgi:outer membrane receptor protein involved in Fe transport